MKCKILVKAKFINGLIVSNYYKILGVSFGASNAEIKSAYRKLIKLHHPDLIKKRYDIKIISLINEAYKTLSDPKARSLYDLNNNFFVHDKELSSVFEDDLKKFQTGASDRNLDPKNYQPDQGYNFDSIINDKSSTRFQQAIYQDDGVGGTIFSTQNPYE